MDKSYTDTTELRLDYLSCIYTPINAQIVRLACSILTTIVMENISFLVTYHDKTTIMHKQLMSSDHTIKCN